MKFLFRFLSLRYRIKSRYWQRRALIAERELRAERYRNLAREDVFASAAVLGQRGMFGIAPRVGPAYQTPQPRQQPPPDPMQLSGADLMEFEIEWKPFIPAHITEAQAKQKFINEVVIPRRQPLMDDPFRPN